jgi:hypothetical protein
VSCCDERNCRRKNPVKLYRGDFSGIVYAVTRARVIKRSSDSEGVFVAVERHDVTPAMREFIRRNPEWVREVLEEG